MKEKKKIGRREFLKVAGTGAAVTTAALYGCKPRTAGSASEADGAQQGQMTYRTNPKTGDRVSLLGYGCMRWPTVSSGSARDSGDEIDQEMVNALVDHAIAHGVNYFDTSPAYCRGHSEHATGVALSRHPRDKYFIATKLSGAQLVEKPLGARGPQCSSQKSRCVGPWGLPGAPLLTGLPPRSSRHWRRSALPSGGYNRIWRHKVNCPEGTREGPLGGARQIRKKPCVARVSLHSSLAAP